jgi:hypothetical protein
MSTAADRQRLHRERSRCGKIILRLEVDEVLLTELLVAAKLLEPKVDHGRSEIERATEKLIELIGDA